MATLGVSVQGDEEAQAVLAAPATLEARDSGSPVTVAIQLWEVPEAQALAKWGNDDQEALELFP